jgi:hypothetical protein
MLNMEITTKLSQKEACDAVKSFFSVGGLGLELEQEGPDCLSFSGGGGFVNATICESDSGNTKIDFQSREWEQQVKAFAEKYAK